MKRKKSLIHGKKLAFLEMGESENPVILFGHSYMWNADTWIPQMEYFSEKGFRCIAPDLWGHGESDPISGSIYSIEQLANDYQAFLGALNIQSVHLVGISVAGMWGTQLALKNPQLIRSLVIMDSYVGDEPKQRQERYFAMLDELLALKKFTPEYIDRLLKFFFSNEAIEKKEDYVLKFQKELLNYTEHNVKALFAIGYGIFSRKSLLEELPKLSNIPSLVAVGEHDTTRPVAEAQKMADLLKSQCTIIKNAGHLPNIEQPHAVTKILDDFFSSQVRSPSSSSDKEKLAS